MGIDSERNQREKEERKQVKSEMGEKEKDE